MENERTGGLNLIKIQDFCASKDGIKTQYSARKYLQNVSDKGLVSMLYENSHH